MVLLLDYQRVGKLSMYTDATDAQYSNYMHLQSCNILITVGPLTTVLKNYQIGILTLYSHNLGIRGIND